MRDGFSEKDMPFVSVIIPTYHDWERLELCINALKEQNYPTQCFEVIIVNNDPADPVNLIDPPNNFKVINEAKPGSYAARNAGLSIAKGEIIAFTDSDCIPCINWLEKGVLALQRSPRVGGHIQLIFKNVKPSVIEIFDKAFSFQQERYSLEYGSAATANMFSYKSVFDEVGFFDDSLYSNEDLAWGRRAKDHGFSIIYSNDCIVHHPARNKFREIIVKSRRVYGGAFLNDRKTNMIYALCNQVYNPFKVLIRLIKNKNLSIFEKFIAFSLATVLKTISIYEIAKVTIGRDPERI